MRSQRLTQSSTPTRQRRSAESSFVVSPPVQPILQQQQQQQQQPQRRPLPSTHRQLLRRQYPPQQQQQQSLQQQRIPSFQSKYETTTPRSTSSVSSLPRVVTPTAAAAAVGRTSPAAAHPHLIVSSPSWDFDGAPPEVVFVGSGQQAGGSTSCDRSVMSEMMPSRPTLSFSSYCPSDRSVLTEAQQQHYKPLDGGGEDGGDDDDMPMDEMLDTLQVMKGKATEMEILRLEAVASKKEIERLHHILLSQPLPLDENNTNDMVPLTIAQIDAADQGGGVGRGVSGNNNEQLNRSLTRGVAVTDDDDDDDVSSLGDAHDVLDDQQAMHSSPSPPLAVAATTNKPAVTDTQTTSAALSRLTQAIRSGTRPANMSLPEQELWNAVQSSLHGVRTDYTSRHRALERQLQESSSKHDHVQLEQSSTQKQYQQALKRIEMLEAELKQKPSTTSNNNNSSSSSSAQVQRLEEKLQQVEKQYQEAHQLATSQQDEHDRELRAIQRVLADISTQKEVEIEKMETKLKALLAEKEALQQQQQQQPVEPPKVLSPSVKSRELDLSATPEGADANPQLQINALKEKIDDLTNSLQEAVAERDAANQELERKSVKNASLERELRSAKVNQAKAVEQQRKREDDNTKKSTVAAAEAAVLDKLKKELEAANEQVKQLKSRVNNDESADDLRTLLQETVTARDAAQQELERKTTKLTNLERELRAVKAKATVANTKSTTATESKALEQAKTELAAALKEIEQLKIREKDLVADVDAKGKQIRTLRRQINTVRNTKEGNSSSTVAATDATSKADTAALEEELTKVRKDLQEKESSLENAKMIIASLESANGSLAVDLRAKLRSKDDELLAMQTEAANRKRTIDSLALELRDLQGKTVTFDPNIESRSKRQIEKHRVLADQLEKSLSELQSALVVHEAATESVGTADDPVVQQISDIFCQSLAIVKASLDVYDLPDETMEMESTFSSFVGTDFTLSSELNRQVDALIRDDREAAAKELRQELESKAAAFKRLEGATKKQSEEITRLRQDYDKLKGEKDSEEERLYAEMRNLRDQCMTNMEVLTKKERELEVLRDSLKVDDGVGYISDDGSDDGDEGQSANVPSPPRISSSLQYGPSQAEALATLLVHGGGASVGKVAENNTGNGNNKSGTSTEELEKLKSDLAKAQADMEKLSRELRAERESLANAKMIISSLEKANKSMMEDLRKRLQDSTTAIAALVDKSMENEKVSNELRKEMEQVKREREDERVKYKVDLKKFKDELLVANLRIAAKDKELEEFRRNKEPQGFTFGASISTAGGPDFASVVTPTNSTTEAGSSELVEAPPSHQQNYQQRCNDDNNSEEDAELAALTGTIDEIPATQDDGNDDDDNVFNYNHDSDVSSKPYPVSS